MQTSWMGLPSTGMACHVNTGTYRSGNVTAENCGYWLQFCEQARSPYCAWKARKMRMFTPSVYSWSTYEYGFGPWKRIRCRAVRRFAWGTPSHTGERGLAYVGGRSSRCRFRRRTKRAFIPDVTKVYRMSLAKRDSVLVLVFVMKLAPEYRVRSSR